MRPSVDRRAVLAGGVAAGSGLILAYVLGRSGDATAERLAAREDHRVLAPPSIVPRAAWGADEELRHGVPHYDSRVEKIVVHHTGTRNDVSDWPLEIRQIYSFETANGYNDMSYHFLVDPNGTIYEGRWARSYAPGATPDTESRDARQVRGGHCKRHNKRTIGIALLGDFTEALPTPAALDAVRALLVWKCARWDIDPLGSGAYTNDDGADVDLPNVFGHGLVRDTQCPGATFAPLIPSLCEQAAAQLA